LRFFFIENLQGAPLLVAPGCPVSSRSQALPQGPFETFFFEAATDSPPPSVVVEIYEILFSRRRDVLFFVGGREFEE